MLWFSFYPSSSLRCWQNCFCTCERFCTTDHDTDTGENEAEVDVALIQPFLLYYVNHVVLMPTGIF